MTDKEAMKMALDALIAATPVKAKDPQMQADAIVALKEALAQPEQEPFGYFQYAPHFDAWVQNRDSNKGVAFYTHPPQREWVGLTDEEIAEGIKQSWVTEQAFQSAAWWAEAKLKEKNT